MQQGQPSWKDKRNQRRKRGLFGSAALVVIIAVIVSLILIVIGAFSPATGTAIIAGGALFVAFLAWQFPRSSPPTVIQNALQLPPKIETVTLELEGTVASIFPQSPVSVSVSNPFNPLVKLLDPDDFYGRISERNTLIDRTRRRASTSIVGPRRIGKTWLLQYLMLVATKGLGADYRMVEMSAHAAYFNTLVAFTEYVLKELKRQTQNGSVVCKILEEALESLEEEQKKSRPEILDILEGAIRDISRKKIVTVLCIDEFNNITINPQRKKQFNLAFFRSLRNMADSQNSSFVLVIASHNSLKRIVGRIGHESGFYNIFDQIMIKPFRLTEAEDFVQTKGDQAQFTDLERDHLLKLGGRGWWLWSQYWPLQLEQTGKAMWDDRVLGPDYFQPEDRKYWRKLKKRLGQKSVF